jgi:Ca-activated chloride channel family protein
MHPQFLWLLPIVIILFYFIMTQKEHQAIFFSDAVLDRLRVTTNRLTLKARNALFALMMILIVVALSGPAISNGKVSVSAKSADIMVALDISDSMLAKDMYPNRLVLAKEKILELLRQSPQERIGVMAFAKDAYLVSPLSFDHASVAFLVKQLNTNSMTQKGTNFEQLLFSASELLSKNKQKYLLIITDGGDADNFDEVIAIAKDKKIKIFILGVAKDEGVPIVDTKNGGYIKQHGSIILTRLNKKIATLATATGGAYIEAIASNEDINAMIVEMHAKTQRKTLKQEEVIRYIPLFYFPLGLAMILFLIATSSLSRRKEVMVPHVLMLGIALLSSQPARANIMDFKLLDEAKQCYEAKDYNRSELLYSDYASRTQDAHAYYNSGNAYYKEGDYKNAQKMFGKVFSDDVKLKQHALHNLGNSYAKEATKESLQKAVESYEKALKIADDKETQENLQRVKEALEKLKQQEKKQNNSSDDKKQSDKKDKNNKKQQKSDKKSTGDKSDEKNSEKSDQKSDKESAKKSQKKSQPQQEQASQNLDKKSQKKQKQPAKASATANDKIMSDLEAKKWLKELNKNKTGHMYQLQRSQNRGEQTDDKPW